MRSQLISSLVVILVTFATCSALRIQTRVAESSSSEDGKVETTTNYLDLPKDESAVISFDDSKVRSEGEDAFVETTTAKFPSHLGSDSADDVVGVTETSSDAEQQVKYDFKYPEVPDVGAADAEFTTVQPVPDDFDIEQLENANISTAVPNTIFPRLVVGRASCACGIPTTRIVGGSTEKINKLPWTAALVRGGIFAGGRPYCGATLINSRYVVTASHCVDGMTARGISVRLNQENVYSSPGVQSFEVSKIIMHPNYNRGTIDNDIALIQLSQPVELTRNSPVVPACLPASSNINIDSFTATAAGWGATAQGGSTSSVLRKVDVPIMSNERCNRESKYGGRITENMLCAGDMERGGKDSCQGDSGGPLIIQNGQRGTLVGVVSWGYGCAQAKAPGVYARVSRYPDWILANTRDADWCDA